MFDPGDGGLEGGTVFELSRDVALREESERGFNSLAGDIFARHSFAEALDAVVQGDTDDDIIGFGPRVGSVLDQLLERNAILPGGEFLEAHGNVILSRKPHDERSDS